MEGVQVHREGTEEVVLGLRDGVAGPVLVDIADHEVLEVAAEFVAKVMGRHGELRVREWWVVAG